MCEIAATCVSSETGSRIPRGEDIYWLTMDDRLVLREASVLMEQSARSRKYNGVEV